MSDKPVPSRVPGSSALCRIPCPVHFALFVAVLIALCRETESAPAAPGVKTDLGIYSPSPAPKLPRAGGTFTDPTFGTEILRVTDEADGKENANAYSYYPSFNKDSTMFFVAMRGSPTLYHFDPITFKITGKEKLYAKKPPSNYDPRWEDSIWSGEDSNVIFCHQGLYLWRYDVSKKVYSLVKDFSKELPPGHLAQMSKSLDDKVFGFSRQDPKWNLVGFLVWRQDTDKIVLREDTRELDEIQVDKTGKYCVIKSNRQGKGVIQVRVADLETGTIEHLIDDAPDYAPGHSDNGHSTVVGMDNWKNRVTFRRLATPHEFYTVLDRYNDWSQDCHISMLADDENWALLSMYVGNKLPSSGVLKNEILQVSTDGKQRVRRLAHHRSVVKQYWDSPRATISRDGRFVVFTSNWEGTGQRDVFILKVPSMEFTRSIPTP